MKERLVGLACGLILGSAGANLYAASGFERSVPHHQAEEPIAHEEAAVEGEEVAVERDIKAMKPDGFSGAPVQPSGQTSKGGVSLIPFADLRGWEVSIVYETPKGMGWIDCKDPIAQPETKRIICEK